MGNAAGVRRDFEGLERRRMEAAQLLKQGVSQSEVARRLGVHRQSVIRWARQLAQSGRAGLKQAGRAGRKPKLSASQLRKIEQALRRGPEALGYASGLWTAGRVRELIEHQCGVRYHEARFPRRRVASTWIFTRSSVKDGHHGNPTSATVRDGHSRGSRVGQPAGDREWLR